MVHVIQKLGSYLYGRPFTIKTNQKSLKFLLEQWLNTTFQQVRMAKLMEFEFDMQYEDGKNDAIYALSKRSLVEHNALLFSNVVAIFYEEIK